MGCERWRGEERGGEVQKRIGCQAAHMWRGWIHGEGAGMLETWREIETARDDKEMRRDEGMRKREGRREQVAL
eukprot:3812565-Rhodomonas_salina.1